MDDTLDDLLESWEIHLTAARKSGHTIAAYRQGVNKYRSWCEQAGVEPDWTTRQAERWIAAELRQGRADTSCRTWQTGLRMFAAWRANELGEQNDVVTMSPIPVAAKAPPYITPEQYEALLDTCTGRTFTELRDRAMIGCLRDTMCRASEVCDMTVEGTRLKQRESLITGKGRKDRLVAFSSATARDIDRYKRVRAQHKLAHLPWLWLPVRIVTHDHVTYNALYQVVRRRAQKCDPPFKLHPHMFRAAGSIEWRLEGGDVSTLMTLNGWNSEKMARHYTMAAEQIIAIRSAHARFDKREGRLQALKRPVTLRISTPSKRPGNSPGLLTYQPIPT